MLFLIGWACQYSLESIPIHENLVFNIKHKQSLDFIRQSNREFVKYRQV